MCGILEGVDLFAMGRILIFLEFGVQVAGHPHKCYICPLWRGLVRDGGVVIKMLFG